MNIKCNTPFNLINEIKGSVTKGYITAQSWSSKLNSLQSRAHHDAQKETR